MASPNACVLITDGTNCNMEMAYALEVAGAMTDMVHVNQLRSGEKQLADYAILALSGGFAYGDDIASGKILATELTASERLHDQVQTHMDAGRPTIGVCNGFQVQVRMGMLPNGTLGKQQVTLAENRSGRFECRWIDLAVGRSACKFVQPEDFAEPTISMQTAHGEGRFFSDDATIAQLQRNEQVVFRYANRDGSGPVEFPANPNGATDNIAGICDPSGLVLGMMPHPERSIGAFHPDRTRTTATRAAAQTIFTNLVSYASES